MLARLYSVEGNVHFLYGWGMIIEVCFCGMLWFSEAGDERHRAIKCYISGHLILY